MKFTTTWTKAKVIESLELKSLGASELSLKLLSCISLDVLCRHCFNDIENEDGAITSEVSHEFYVKWHGANPLLIGNMADLNAYIESLGFIDEEDVENE